MSSVPSSSFYLATGEHRRSNKKEGFGATPIHSLPIETLAHVFAQLPPSALGVASLVCRDWHDVIADEASWRSAFENYYGILEADGAVALGRRLEPTSWRAEYIARVALLHRWSKSRTPSLTYNPSIGPFSAMHIHFPTSPLPIRQTTPSSRPSTPPPSLSPTLLALSLPLGTAIQSTPFTGKVGKHPLPANPTDNLGRPLGHLPLVPVTAGAISPDGGRAVWGMRDGGIRFIACPPGGGRGWAGGAGERGEVRSVQGYREGVEVVAVGFAEVVRGIKARGDAFVSVGSDGVVLGWVTNPQTAAAAIGRERAEPARRVWSARLPSTTTLGLAGAPERATVVAFDSGWEGRSNGRRASVAVGTSSGAVHVWLGVCLGAEEGEQREERERSYSVQVGEGAVDTLRLDPGHGGQLALFAHVKHAATFHRYPFPPFSFAENDAPQPTRTTFGHKPDHLSALTAFAFDFSPPPPLPLFASSSNGAKESKVSLSFTPHSTVGTPTSEMLPGVLSLALAEAQQQEIAPLYGANLFGRSKYVVGGDALGRTFLWDWEAETREDARDEVQWPRRMVQGFESQVTALEVSEVGVFVGGLDGTLRVYCPLTSTLLRTFKDRSAPRLPSRMLAQGLFNAEEEERWAVSHVRAGRGEMVAAVGGRVVVWKVGGEVKKGKGKVGAGRLSARSERVRSDFELRQEVKESLDSLTSEQTDRVRRLGHERYVATEYGLPPSLENMTEEEAVALALMLSAEEEEGRWFAGGGSASSSVRASPAWEAVPDELLEMEGLDLDGGQGTEVEGRAFGNRRADVEDQEGMALSSSGSRSLSLSLSVPTSPTLRGTSLGSSTSSSPSRSSYTWRPSPASHRSPSFAAYEPHAHATSASSPGNMKVQLSPRLGPTYGSVGTIPQGPVPDMSEELWPTAAGAGVGVSPPRTSATSTPARRGWSEVARSASASPSPSPSPSPWTAATSPAPPPRGSSSLLADQLRRGGGRGGENDVEQAERESREEELRRREEEELRFALELSEVEERSRMEV